MANMPQVLGYLESGTGNKDAHGSYEIIEGIEIMIGRDAASCQVVLSDASISKRHIRIYSVIYDQTVEPFVYAEDLSMNGSRWLFKKRAAWKSYPMENGSAFLLSSGDKIQLCDGSSFVFHAAPFLQDVQHSEDVLALQAVERKAFNSYYTITSRQLGSGAAGRVLMTLDHCKQRQRACKIISLKSLHRNHPNRVKLWREVEILGNISHPNIIRVEQVFHTDNTIYIIEDLVTGGDLASYIDQKGDTLHNDDACAIIYQIAKALQYLHKHEIVHRDLKPENVLMSSLDTGARIVIADFGQAIKAVLGPDKRPRRMETLCGTLDWVAPEVQGRNKLVTEAGYTKSVDMWSLGCVTTALLNGSSFFVNSQDSSYKRDSATAVYTAAAKCDLSLLDEGRAWEDVQPRAKDFVKGLLNLDENARMNAEQALDHAWFTEGQRKAWLEEEYRQITKGWSRTTSAADFIENLDVWIEIKAQDQLLANRERLRARQMHSAKQLEEFMLSKNDDQKVENPWASRKRQRSTCLSASEVAIYTEAGKENRGFVSAKTYGQTVAKKRLVKEQQGCLA